MNYYRFSDLTISMTCRYDIMKRRAEKYLIPKAKENELYRNYQLPKFD